MMESIVQQAKNICDSSITKNNITDMNTLYSQMNTHILLKDAPLMRPICKMIKRIFDIIVATLFLVLIFPWTYIIIACCIKICMPVQLYSNKRELEEMEKFSFVINSEQWMLTTMQMNMLTHK